MNQTTINPRNEQFIHKDAPKVFTYFSITLLVVGILAAVVFGLGMANAIGVINLMSPTHAMILACASGGGGLGLAFVSIIGIAIASILKRKSNAIRIQEDSAFEAFKERVFKRYQINEAGKLFYYPASLEGNAAEQEAVDLGITKDDLSRFMDDARRATTPVYSATINNIKLSATKTDRGTLKIYTHGRRKQPGQADGKALGGGSFGMVREVTNVTKARHQALKSAHKDNDDASNDLEKEFQILKTPGLQGIGIQVRPSALFQGRTRAMLGTQYEVSLLHLQKSTGKMEIEEWLMCAFHTTSGLERGHRVGILFGDRKRANVLVTRGERYDLADLGGSTTTSQVPQLLEASQQAVALCPAYTSYRDLCMYQEAEKAKDVEKVIEIVQKIDVLGQGITLWEALTGASFPLKKDTYAYANPSSPNVAQKLDELVASTAEAERPFTQEMKTFLLRMLDPDYNKRPTSQEALEGLHQLLSGSHPDLFERFTEQAREADKKVQASASKRVAKYHTQ